MPFDAGYEQQRALNQNVLNQALAQIGYQRGRVGYEYGFNQQGGMDLSNPNNRAALLERSYKQGQTGTTNAYAGRGNLYSGSHQRSLDEGTRRHNVNYDQLRTAALDAFQRLAGEEQQARFAFDQGNILANQDRLDRLADYRPPDPGPPPQPLTFNLKEPAARGGPPPQRTFSQGTYGRRRRRRGR